MAKNELIREDPVSLNESTLEANIAAEITALFNCPINFAYNYRLRSLFGFERINFGAFRKRKAKLYRLTPIEENRGGGWDTKITIPTSNNERRAIFIQFKKGDHSDGNDIAKSVFNLEQHNPNKHVQFAFNNNTSKNDAHSNNQHECLKKLSDQLAIRGLSPNSVMYGFPRITQISEFDNLEEDLLLHTSFLTIPEMDDEANVAKINLYDRNVHHFRTCYFNENKREIASELFQLKNQNNIENIISEIAIVKLSYMRNQLKYREFPIELINNELLLNLADYLKIDPSKFIDWDKFYPKRISDEMKRYYNYIIENRDNNFSNMYGQNTTDSLPFAWRERVFTKSVDFFNSFKDRKINIENDIPSIFTFNLPQKEKIEIDITGELNTSLIVF